MDAAAAPSYKPDATIRRMTDMAGIPAKGARAEGTRTKASATKHARQARSGPAIEAACRAKGLRVTGQRRIIAEVLDQAEDHPDVVELHRRAAAIDPRISLSTVYRTVKLFESEGIIERLEFRDGRSRYEGAPGLHHDHLIDLSTGRVVEFRSDEIEALQNEVARRLGFRLVHHRLELYAVPLGDEDPPAGGA